MEDNPVIEVIVKSTKSCPWFYTPFYKYANPIREYYCKHPKFPYHCRKIKPPKYCPLRKANYVIKSGGNHEE